MQATLIEQGFSLLLFGMGTVFVFLTLLVVVTTVMSKLIIRHAPETNESAISSTSPEIEPRILKVIQAAIKQHRK